MKELRVTGKGKVSVKPDLIRIKIETEGVQQDYEAAVKASSEATNTIKEALAELGFDKSDVKTSRYNVQVVYESYQAKDRSWKRRFNGYQYNHDMKIEFSIDNERLGQILYAIAHCNVNPEFSIEYTVENPDSVKDELLRKAIEDSKHKAEILASASGVEVDEIVSINYSWGEIDLVTRPFGEINNRLLEDCDYNEDCEYDMEEFPSSYGVDVEPDDIKVADTVTVIWSLK